MPAREPRAIKNLIMISNRLLVRASPWLCRGFGVNFRHKKTEVWKRFQYNEYHVPHQGGKHKVKGP